MASRALISLALLVLVGSAGAGEAQPLAVDPQLEARVLEVAGDMRCLVCQNETLAASQSGLAADLRRQIGQQLEAGRSPAQIREYMVERYGDFVLYRPVFKPTTALLWLGPFALLAGAFAWLARFLRRRSRVAAPPGLSAEQRRRARRLLGGEEACDP
jgi:cytochrome c-type biogenesis protein CcmH